MVNAVEGVLEPLAEKNGVELLANVSSDVPLIVADGEKVVCAVENLVGNAIKFTPAGGRVFVDVYLKKRTNEVVVRVCDDGVGIEPEKLPVIFDAFVQGDSSATRRYSGSGLGLSLAKRMVELHGGRISVASEVGEGSIFTVVLPLDAGAAVETKGEDDA